MNKNGPLMYINTVTSEITKIKQQEIYDSSKHKEKQTIPQHDNLQNNLTIFEDRKLNNIIQMYQKGRPVLCNIITNESEIIGVPYERCDNVICVKVAEEDTISISLSVVKAIDIIKF